MTIMNIITQKVRKITQTLYMYIRDQSLIMGRGVATKWDWGGGGGQK